MAREKSEGASEAAPPPPTPPPPTIELSCVPILPLLLYALD